MLGPEAQNQAIDFIQLAISKTMEMQQDLESHFTVRIGPQEIALIRESPCTSMPIQSNKASPESLCRGIVDAIEKSIEIHLELASALSALKGRPIPEVGHRGHNEEAA
jgi:hypothetical protein